MAASQVFGTGRVVGRFATIVLAAATAIGAGPTTLGLALADSPPVTLAAASTSTASWTWKAEGLGGSDNDSGEGSSEGSGSISGSPGGNDSDSESGSGDSVEVAGRDSENKDSANREAANEANGESKKLDDQEKGNNPTAVGEDANKAKPGENGTTTVEGGQQNDKLDENGAASATAQPPGKPQPGTGVNDSAQPGGQETPVFPGLGPNRGRQPAQNASNLSPVIRQTNPSEQLPAHDPVSPLVTKYGTPAQTDSNLSPVIQQTSPTNPLPASDPMSPLIAKYGPSGPGASGKNPNEWSVWPPTPKDYLWNGAGSLVTANGSVWNDVNTRSDTLKQIDRYRADQPIYQEVARKAPDPITQQAFLDKAAGAAKGEAFQQQKLQTTTAIRQAADNLPEVSKVGGFAGKLVEGAGRIPGTVGTVLNLAQGGADIVFEGKSVGRVASETTGSIAGGAAGTAVGGFLGSFIPIPVVGTALGAAAGNALGSYFGGKLGDVFADKVMDEGN